MNKFSNFVRQSSLICNYVALAAISLTVVGAAAIRIKHEVQELFPSLKKKSHNVHVVCITDEPIPEDKAEENKPKEEAPKNNKKAPSKKTSKPKEEEPVVETETSEKPVEE